MVYSKIIGEWEEAMTITLYTTSTCPYCKQEEEYLDTKGISYTKVVLDQQPEKLAEFRQISPEFSGVPLTVVVGNDGKGLAVRGFNKVELDKVLESVSKPPKQAEEEQAGEEIQAEESEEKPAEELEAESPQLKEGEEDKLSLSPTAGEQSQPPTEPPAVATGSAAEPAPSEALPPSQPPSVPPPSPPPSPPSPPSSPPSSPPETAIQTPSRDESSSATSQQTAVEQ